MQEHRCEVGGAARERQDEVRVSTASNKTGSWGILHLNSKESLAPGPEEVKTKKKKGLRAQASTFLDYLPAHMQGVAGILVVSSCLALAYNVVHATMIHRLSAVTTTVLGEAKIVALLVLSAMFLGALPRLTQPCGGFAQLPSTWVAGPAWQGRRPSGFPAMQAWPRRGAGDTVRHVSQAHARPASATGAVSGRMPCRRPAQCR